MTWGEGNNLSLGESVDEFFFHQGVHALWTVDFRTQVRKSPHRSSYGMDSHALTEKIKTKNNKL